MVRGNRYQRDVGKLIVLLMDSVLYSSGTLAVLPVDPYDRHAGSSLSAAAREA